MNLPTNSGRPLTDYLYAKASRAHIPLNGTFELSPVCNFNCRMCYVRQTTEEVAHSPRPILELDDWRRLAREARDSGMLELLLTGGEPLLWHDFWTLYEELCDMGFLVSINTNGSLIDRTAIERFRKRPPQKLNITLYGAGDESYYRLCGAHDAFDWVDRAVRGLLAEGLTVRLNCSLTPYNADDLDRIVDYAHERNTVLSTATYMFPPVRRDPTGFGDNDRFTPEESSAYLLRYLRRDRGEERFRTYVNSLLKGYADPPGLEADCADNASADQSEHIRCRAGRASFWITWDGRMLPCGMLPKPEIDVKGRSFAEAWELLWRASAEVTLSGVCGGCPNRGICHPCAAIAYAETGSHSGIPTYRCHAVRHMCALAREMSAAEDSAAEQILKNLPGGRSNEHT